MVNYKSQCGNTWTLIILIHASWQQSGCKRWTCNARPGNYERCQFTASTKVIFVLEEVSSTVQWSNFRAPRLPDASVGSNKEGVTFYSSIWQSKRASNPREIFDDMLVHQCLIGCADGPLTLEEALTADDITQLKSDWQLGLDIVDKKFTWTPKFMLKGKKVIWSKWVFNRKRNINGTLDRHRPRLFLKQVPGVE